MGFVSLADLASFELDVSALTAAPPLSSSTTDSKNDCSPPPPLRRPLDELHFSRTWWWFRGWFPERISRLSVSLIPAVSAPEDDDEHGLVASMTTLSLRRRLGAGLPPQK